MPSDHNSKYLVAVVGAGPAGIYAADELASAGVRVLLLNRDIKPGGLAEYGIYPNKYKMKGGLRKHFQRILSRPEIEYYGNVTIGTRTGITLDDLIDCGVQAVLVTVGAQGTKWLGLPGEEHTGVHHAKDLVYHYNGLPPFGSQEYAIGHRAALIGVGNVMCDIAHWTVRNLKIEHVVAIARRGPAEVKFTKKEFQLFSRNMDLEDFDREFHRCIPIMEGVGQDLQAAKEFILSGFEKGQGPNSKTRFAFDFFASPKQIIGDEQGRVLGLEVDDTHLIIQDGQTKARNTGETRMIDVDTVVFCIGDEVETDFGLPLEWNEFAKNPEPRYPIKETSYEAYDPEAKKPIDKIFLAGWARKASEGLVGVARKDGTCGARALLTYLERLGPATSIDSSPLRDLLSRIAQQVVGSEELFQLIEIEKTRAEQDDLPEFKFHTNKEMLEAIGMAGTT